jgi:hypothetical protein
LATHYNYFTTLLSRSVNVQIHIGKLMNCCLNQLTPFYVSHIEYIFLRNRLDFRKIARTLVESIQSLYKNTPRLCAQNEADWEVCCICSHDLPTVLAQKLKDL